jgi:hypothetical protein
LLRRFEQHPGGAVLGGVLISVGFGLFHWVQGGTRSSRPDRLALLGGALPQTPDSVAPVVSHAAFNSLGYCDRGGDNNERKDEMPAIRIYGRGRPRS